MRPILPLPEADSRALFVQHRHADLWREVPPAFRVWDYDLAAQPWVEVFMGCGTKHFRMSVEDVPVTIAEEVAWWVWQSHKTGDRQLNPSWVRNFVFGVAETLRTSRQPASQSLLHLGVSQVQHGYREHFYRRYGRLPSPKVTAHVAQAFMRVQEALSRWHDQREWWQRDRWSPRDDPRIPVRRHEPLAGHSLRFERIDTPWLRPAVRYWYRILLETGQATWGSLNSFLCTVSYFDEYVKAEGLTGPALVKDPSTQLRAVMLGYLSFLRSRLVTIGPHVGRPLSLGTVQGAQLKLADLYLFMVDHRHELATETGDARFLDLSPLHARLWRRTDLVHRDRVMQDSTGSRYIAPADLTRMMGMIEVLGAGKTETVTVVRDGAQVDLQGFADPSAMRVWLIQALTGRRASEVLLTDFDPLESVPGIDAARNADEASYVARYRYQQTKVREAPNTIMVGQDVVAIIKEQQAWTRAHLRLSASDPAPRYLFPQLRCNRRGYKARGLACYQSVLAEFSAQVLLRDEHDRVLRFSQSHRLRHTKATNLLNLGAPIHVVMRYLGHRSPEMTVHYAATLAQTAEREFLRTQKIGYDGRELGVSPQDVYDMVALSSRTDRVLPTGVCLLPPAKRCDKGNACYSCQFFATDSSYLSEHRQLLADTAALIEVRKAQVRERTGRELTEDNIWLGEQLATIRALQLVIASLEQHTTAEHALRGAGVRGRDGYQSKPVSVQLTTRAELVVHG